MSNNPSEKNILSERMGTQALLPLIFKMSLPSMFSMLIQALYNVVDSIFVSRLGETALSAVSLVYPIQMLNIAVGVGTAVGTTSLVSRKLGAKNHEEAQKAASNGVFLALCSSVVFLVFGLFFSRTFVCAFSENPSLIEPAVDYCTIISVCAVFPFVAIQCERIMQGCGDTVTPMLCSLSGAVTNLVLDPIMIFGYFGCPKLGVAGAAYATVIGQFVQMAVTIIFVNTKHFAVKVTMRNFRPDGRIIAGIYQVGFPAMVMQAIGSVLNLCMNAMLIKFSETAVAVLGVYYKVQSFVFLPVFGMNQGLLPILAYNYGAGKKKRLTEGMRIGLVIALIIMCVGTLIFQIFPGQILSLFDAKEDMMNIGTIAMRTISYCFPFAAVGIILGTIFQASGHGMYSMIISVLRQLLLILPMAKLFSVLWGLEGIWWSYPAAECVSLIVVLFLYRHLWNSELKYLEEH